MDIIKGLGYFMLILLVIWIGKGFVCFMVDSWPVIKVGILIGAGLFLFKSMSELWKKL